LTLKWLSAEQLPAVTTHAHSLEYRWFRYMKACSHRHGYGLNSLRRIRRR